MARILVVDDSAGIRIPLADILTDELHVVSQASDGNEALDLLSEENFDLVISDIVMPAMDGLELLRETKKLRPETGFIIITANPSVQTAQQAFREGAFDYILKETLLTDTVAAVTRAMERLELRRENKMLHEALHEKYAFGKMAGKSPQMQNVFATVRKVLFNETTVMITGETGSGKELVAKAIHFNGKRRNKPFVAVNCAAIPKELLESELFGHVRGAFTGAIASKKGLFEAANGGTIFLDEITEMALDLQGKLLRVLQEREVQPVGATSPRKIDVRVIAASNRIVEREVEARTFRADLFYRLNVVPIMLPPLRNRQGDIEHLAKHFLHLHCASYGVPEKRLANSALECLCNYNWPGNVRELENEIERAVSLREEPLLTSDAFRHLGRREPTEVTPVTVTAAAPPANDSVLKSLADAERDHIFAVIRACGGNKSKASRILDINYSTLYRKLKRWEKDGLSSELE